MATAKRLASARPRRHGLARLEVQELLQGTGSCPARSVVEVEATFRAPKER